MMCLYSRRRQNLKRWKHMEQLLIERSLQQSLSIYSSIYQKSYVPSTATSGQHNWYDADQMRGMRALMTLMPVINEHRNEASTYTTATQTMTDVSKMSSILQTFSFNHFVVVSFIRFVTFIGYFNANEVPLIKTAKKRKSVKNEMHVNTINILQNFTEK